MALNLPATTALSWFAYAVHVGAIRNIALVFAPSMAVSDATETTNLSIGKQRKG